MRLKFKRIPAADWPPMSQFYDTFTPSTMLFYQSVVLSHSLDAHTPPLNCLYRQNTTTLVSI